MSFLFITTSFLLSIILIVLLVNIITNIDRKFVSKTEDLVIVSISFVVIISISSLTNLIILTKSERFNKIFSSINLISVLIVIICISISWSDIHNDSNLPQPYKNYIYSIFMSIQSLNCVILMSTILSFFNNIKKKEILIDKEKNSKKAIKLNKIK